MSGWVKVFPALLTDIVPDEPLTAGAAVSDAVMCHVPEEFK
jgi:hypothetical protein